MPGATMAANTRETRASRSRFSSPQVNSQSPNGRAEQQASSSKGQGTGLDGQKAFMARWLEPPVAVKPSYQDAGLMRHGVVEGMAPLGTLPKVGIFKKTATPAAPSASPPVRTPPPTRIVLKRPANSAPKPAPAPVTPAPPTEDDTEVDDDETSEDEQEANEGLIAPPPRPSSRRASVRQTHDSYTASRRSMSRASTGRHGSTSLTSPSNHRTQTSANSMQRLMEGVKDVADKVLKIAIQEAISHERYPTAWALTVLEKENRGNDEFSTMVSEVFTQSAPSETSRQFARMVYEKKKEGKRGHRAYLHFVTPEMQAARGPKNPQPAPYGSLLVQSKAPEVEVDPRQTTSDLGQEAEASSPAPAPLPAPPASQPAAEQAHQTPSRSSPESHKKRKKLPDEPRAVVEETPAKKHRKSPTSKASESATPAPTLNATPKATPKVVVMAPSTGKSKSKSKTGNGNGGTSAHSRARAKLTESPSTRRKAREGSVASNASSTSTLSSARSLTPPAGIMDSDQDVEMETRLEMEEEEDKPSRPSPAAETVTGSDSPKSASRSARGANAPAVAPQPITRPKRISAPKKKRNVSPTTPATPAASSPAIIPATTNHNNTSTTTTTRAQQTAAAAAAAALSMPALIEPPIYPNLPPPTKNAYKAAGARHDKGGIPVFASRVGKLDDNDVKIRLRLKAKSVTNGAGPLQVSFNRYDDDEAEKEPSNLRSRLQEAATSGGDVARSSPRASRASGAATVFTEAVNGNSNAASRSTRSSRKRSHDEADDGASPTTAQFPPGALDDTSTPATSRAETPILRPAKKAKTGARVKQSPMKKKSGTSAGIPRPSGERRSPPPNGALQDENDDYCSSCGGNGELLCCDGCTRAFHLICVDPPVYEDQMPADWYCNVCLKARNAFGRHSGAFKFLLERLDPKNSSAFRLPLIIREYFEGVRTGPDGEYEDIVAVQKPSNSRKKKVEEDVPDFFRLMDNDGNAVLCHLCAKPTQDNRPIIPCSVCALWWHIDCLDPPLAQPPVLRTWTCPAHSEPILSKLPGARGPAHRHRLIKNAPLITPIYSRGNVNNGVIEVIDDLSEDESGVKDRNTFGRVQRLSGKGIWADFSYKVRKNRKGKPIAPLAAVLAPFVPPAPTIINQDDVERQQAALNLAQLSGHGDGVTTLVDTLLANADPSVISLIARANIAGKDCHGLPLYNKDNEQGLRAVLTFCESLGSAVRNLMGPAAPGGGGSGELPSPATPAADGRSSNPSARTGPFDELATALPSVPAVEFAGPPKSSTASAREELPSPPATDHLQDDGVKSRAGDEEEEGGVIVAADMPEIKDEAPYGDAMDLE